MSLVFFVSSVGDTDLAKATINRLKEQKIENDIFLVPLTGTAEKQTENFIDSEQVKRVTLDKIVSQRDVLLKKQFTKEEIEKIMSFIEINNVKRAFIGVPSPIDEDIPFQIAQSLNIPYTIAYEYMFTAPSKHNFWAYVDRLASQKNCDFAVPSEIAKEEIMAINNHAKVFTIGHLSIDRGLADEAIAGPDTKKHLEVNEYEELVLASGTTQPTEVDNQFLDALLQEISTGKYPNLQLRFGIHPGVKELDTYLETLLRTCKKHLSLSSRFKIILPSQLEQRLQLKINHEDEAFILRANVSGAQAAQSADKIAQAVPGALLNEAALKGKPSYFHVKSSNSYLPKAWFCENISSFFMTKRQSPHTKEELGINEDAPNLMVKLMNSYN